jgi:hypothetical protein
MSRWDSELAYAEHQLLQDANRKFNALIRELAPSTVVAQRELTQDERWAAITEAARNLTEAFKVAAVRAATSLPILLLGRESDRAFLAETLRRGGEQR